MSSFLSLFKSDDDDPTRPDNPSPFSSSGGGGGLIKEAFSHHLRGVAAFLAPPPHQHQENSNTTTVEIVSSQTINGIKNDLAEIEKSFKSSLSLLSTKLTSNFLQFSNNRDNKGDDTEEEDEYGDEEEEVAGIDDEVVEFVRELSSRPEFWTDFPVDLPNDYNMSDSQREHAETIEDLVPSLVTLRQDMCSRLSDGQFWMIYFTILLPRFNENDLKHLSTPEIVEVRETLLQKLQRERMTLGTSDQSEAVITSGEGVNFDSKHEEKSLSQQNNSGETLSASQEAKTVNSPKPDQWLKNENAGPSSRSFDAQGQAQNEEDVSFSDLEDDEKDLSVLRQQRNPIMSRGESSEWIQLTENSGAQASQRKRSVRGKDSEGESSSDWHHVDDIDCESLASD